MAAAAPKTLTELATSAGIPEAELKLYDPADFDELLKELLNPYGEVGGTVFHLRMAVSSLHGFPHRSEPCCHLPAMFPSRWLRIWLRLGSPNSADPRIRRSG